LILTLVACLRKQARNEILIRLANLEIYLLTMLVVRSSLLAAQAARTLVLTTSVVWNEILFLAKLEIGSLVLFLATLKI